MGFWTRLGIAAAAMVTTVPAHAAEVWNVDVTGIRSDGISGAPENVVLTNNIGAGARVIGVGYAATITAFAPSLLSEVAVEVLNANDDGVYIAPGFADAVPGTGEFSGFSDLDALGLSFNVGDDGLLRLRFFEWVDQLTLSPDATWDSGWVYVVYEPGAAAIPEPATWAMMVAGVGLAGAAARRRRATAVATC